MNFKTQFINDLNNRMDININFDDIKSKINVSQYIQEKNKKITMFELVKSNKTYKIAGLSALAIVLSLGIVLPIALSNYDGGGYGDTSTGAPMKYPHIFTIYGAYENHFFANVKVLKIEESLYVNKENVDRKYLVVKCEVVEDFYNVLENKQIVYIPFKLYDANFDINSLKEWLLTLESLCVYSSIDNSYGELDFSFTNNLISEKDGKSLKVNIPIESTSFDIHNTIPLFEGKVDVDTIRNLSDGHFCGSWLLHLFVDNQYIKQGMDKDTLFENLRSLYNDQLEGRNNNKS